MIEHTKACPKAVVYIRFNNGLYYIGQTYDLTHRYKPVVRSTILYQWNETNNEQRYANEKEFIAFAIAIGLPLANKHLRGNLVTSKEKLDGAYII